MKLAPILLAACALTLSLPALAQYQWIDKDGRRVFSDRPPPADVPARNILSRPRAAAETLPLPAPAASAAAPAGAAANPPNAGIDKALEEKKKQAEAAAVAKHKDDEAKQAAMRADNCQRARNARSTLASGMRMSRVDASGERRVLDDADRAAELKRVNEIIRANCK